MRKWPLRALTLLCLACSLSARVPHAKAGGVGISSPPDFVPDSASAVGLQVSAGFSPTAFRLYKPDPFRSRHANRDYEFLWSETYRSYLRTPLDTLTGPEHINDLQRLAEAAAENQINPLGLPMTNIQIVYNTLAAHTSYRNATYNENEQQVGFRVAQPDTEYAGVEGTHIDAYVYARNFAGYAQWPQGYGGEGTPRTKGNAGVAPSDFVSSAEDSLAGHAGDPRRMNSVCIAGPFPSEVGVTGSTTWTRARGRAIGDLLHESEHSLNADATAGGLHFFASAAEVVIGPDAASPHHDFDYHYGLHPDPSSRDGNGNAYPHWQSFMAYVAYNWRGADTTAAGWRDDLLPRWATRGLSERNLLGLAQRLNASECAECVNYPGFAGLGGVDRAQRLIHDWRVALYVNNSQLPGGKYGYPPQFGYLPAVQIGAWQNVDGDAPDDTVSVPPVLTLGTPGSQTDRLFTSLPTNSNVSTRPLKLSMFGAEYFIFKADPALSAYPKKVFVNVRSPQPGYMFRDAPHYPACDTVANTWVGRPARLFASLITYSQASDSLFQHPEWATGVVTQSVLLDSLRDGPVFEVPSFGHTNKAFVLVVTLVDGPQGYYSTGTNFDQVVNSQPFSLRVVVGDSSLALTERALVASAHLEDQAAWSANGSRIAYRDVDPGSGQSRIFLRAADGSGLSTPLNASSEGQFHPVWSPRENRIAYSSGSTGRRLWLADAATGVEQRLTNNTTGVAGESCFLLDGGRIAYLLSYVSTLHDSLPRDSSALVSQPVTTYRAEVRLLNLTTLADSLLASFVNEVEVGPGEYWGLRCSPNGGYLTFSGRQTAGQPICLYQCDLRTRALTTHNSQAPFAVLREVRPGAGRLLVEEPGLLVPLECSPQAYWVCGCRDGGDVSPAPLAVLPAPLIALRDTIAGSSIYLTYKPGVVNSAPRWSPDGTKVLYTRTENGNSDVCVIAATSDRAPLFSSSVQTYYSADACVPFELSLAATDPDGDAVTYEMFGLPDGAELQSGHNLHWGYPIIGDHWLVARALDPAGAVATRLIHVNIFDAGGCGGGGGEDPGEIIPLHGLHARSAIATRKIGSGSDVRSVNSFLDGAASGEWVSQTARLVAAVADSEGHVGTRVVGLRPGILRADRARLLVVDHPAGTIAVATNAGIAVGSRRYAEQLTLSNGEDLTALFRAPATEARILPAGAVVTLDLASRDSVAGLLVDCARAEAVEANQEWGIRVEVPDSSGWSIVGRIHPRTGHDVLALPLDGERRARLVFLSDVAVRDMAGYSFAGMNAASFAVTSVACGAASTESGVANLAEADSVAVELTQAQGVNLWFDGPPAIAETQRTLFLDLVASFTPEAGATQMASREAGGVVPLRFALHSNRPNPFGAGTTVRFDVPRAATVRIEIFDAQGRRVRMLADKAFEPGSHGVAWDGMDGRGMRVSPGVYLYRMTSDHFREQRRMVMLGR